METPVEFSSWFLVFESYFEFEAKKSSARAIQSLFRKNKATKEVSYLREVVGKVTLIQTCVRRYLAKQRAKQRLAAVSRLQGALRPRVAKSKDFQDREAAVRIQSWIRACYAQRVLALLKLEQLRMRQATRQGRLIGAELEKVLSVKIYRAADRASRLEVQHLLAHDETSVHSSSVCLRRLAKRVVLGRIHAEQEENRVREAQNALEFERYSLSKMAESCRTIEGPGGVENIAR